MANILKRLVSNKLIIFAILVLATLLRFWKLGDFPALNADEAAIGYNAWSLLQTGMDEHGNSWPVHFQSFNDYKPGLFFYIVLPFVKLFGLSSLAVRIPGALAGVATVWVVYHLAKELLDDQWLALKEKRKSIVNTESLAMIAAFFLAISPWHIHFSRGGWEVNVATFFITLGLWLLLRYLSTKKFKTLGMSVAAFVLSLYSYHAARVVVPLLVLVTVLVCWSDFKNNFKSFILAGFLGLLLLFPLAHDLTTGAVASRAAGVGIFSDPGPLNRINEQRGEHTDLASISAKATHNKPVNYLLAFLQNWGDHYHGEFLFLSGDEIQRSRVPEMGQMYLYDLFFVICGLAVLLKNFRKGAIVLAAWVLIAPIASALTFQSPHALRSHNMVVPLIIISALGFASTVGWLQAKLSNKQLLAISYSLLALLISWQFARYEHMYWRHMAKEYPSSSQYGVKELADYIKENGDKYDSFVITDRYDQPYILTLFYLQYPPSEFQNDHELTARDGYGFSTVRDFGKFHFYSVENHWEEIKEKYPGALIAGTPDEIPDAGNVIGEIKGSNDHVYFQLVAN